MNAAVLTDGNTETSPRLQARMAGFLYLIVIVAGLFAEIFVREALTVSGDAAATARNILAHELRFRLGFAAELIAGACNIPLAVIFYNLFRVVNRSLAWAVVFFTLVGTAIGGVVLLSHFAPLILLKGGGYLSVFKPEQLQAGAYMSLRLQSIGFAIALVFFGFYCLALGTLIFRSTFFPRIIGVLLAIEGAGYLINSFLLFLAPGLQARIFPYFMATGIGEVALCLWLFVMGVNVQRWKEQAGVAGEWRS